MGEKMQFSELDQYLFGQGTHYDIYKKLAKRMDDEAISLGVSTNGIENYSATGDTADIWSGDKVMALMPDAPFNMRSFNIKADTAFRKGDALLFKFSSEFILQDGMRDGIAVISVRFNNDSIASRMQQISSNSTYMLEIRDDSHIGIKEIRGYIMVGSGVGGRAHSLKLLCVNNIHLLRMHEDKRKKKTETLTDTVNTVIDTMKNILPRDE